MKCPICGFEDSKVVDSRPMDEGEKIKRRRECLSCQKRFTTFEMIETHPIMVVKRDGSMEPFNGAKLLKSMLHACEKRQVSLDALERGVREIEMSLGNTLEAGVQSTVIGEMAMLKLRNIDEPSYIRFVSVYRQFKDVETFLAALQEMSNPHTKEEITVD